MIFTIALWIVLGWIILMFIPYILVAVFYVLALPFIAIGWIWEKLNQL